MGTGQNQTGFSISFAAVSFGPKFLDEAECRRWVLARLHGSRACCPGCGAELSGKHADRFWEVRRVRCSGCGKKFSATTGTMMANTQLAFAQVFLMAVLLAKGLGNPEIGKVIGCDPETVRLWKMRFALHG